MIIVLNINENISELFKNWNFWLSLITGLTAVIALVLTLIQIRLSNKQSLFERRLECYLKIDGLMQLYKENQKLLESERKDEPIFAVDLEFLWLTNNTYLEEASEAIKKPLKNPGHKKFLLKREELKKLSTEVELIFKGRAAKTISCFISDYDVLKTFCPTKEELNFLGFDEVINNGKIVVLNMNINEYSYLSKIIAAYLKLDFQTDVMTRLANTSNNNFRSVCFISDEYSEYCTETDCNFFSQSREAKCINIVATQSYTSLLNTLHDQSSVNVIIQNLINKLWFRNDDIFTIENAQKQIGKEDKEKVSRGISENAKETVFSYFTNSLNSKNSSISESITTNIQNEYIYDTNFFTRNLTNFHCLGFLSTGSEIIPPTEIKLYPYFYIK